MFGKYIVAIAAAAAAVMAQTINTPAALTTCQPVQLSWNGGSSPYFLSVIPGGQPSAAALVDFGQQTGTTYTWTVNLAAGTSVTLKLTDSSGNTVYSSPVTILAGSSTSCVGSSVAASSGASTAASSGATGVVASASSALSSASGAASSGVSSASGAASSAVSSASARATSATSAAASGASSASKAASSGASGASSAAASATSGTSGASKTVAGSIGALVLAAIGVVMV